MNIHPNIKAILGIAAVLAAFFMGQFIDSPSDWEAEKASAASLRDTLAQQQAERPDLWNAAQKKRGDVAAGIVAKEYGHE